MHILLSVIKDEAVYMHLQKKDHTLVLEQIDRIGYFSTELAVNHIFARYTKWLRQCNASDEWCWLSIELAVNHIFGSYTEWLRQYNASDNWCWLSIEFAVNHIFGSYTERLRQCKL